MVITTTEITKQKAAPAKLVVNPDRAIHWLGTVNYDSAQNVTADIKQLVKEDPKEHVDLIISSPGGASGIAMSFYDTMKLLYKPRLRTIGSGDVDSSGIIIFLTGAKRYLTPHTTLLFHLAGRTFESGKRFSTAEMECSLKEDKLKDYYYACIVAEGSGNRLLPQEVLDMMAAGTVLTAHEAVEYGLADAVIE
ncbi:MAG TPA: ATP-dependent Clp protease proteolytic subunit [Candidatus Paceibacterota bacterium]|nr:ATP-dependent Clp protease proteolytic subunit [Candidatus Paceibacterota bacterium]